MRIFDDSLFAFSATNFLSMEKGPERTALLSFFYMHHCTRRLSFKTLEDFNLLYFYIFQILIKKTKQRKIAKKKGVIQPRPLDTWQLPQPIAAAQLYWSTLAKHMLNLQFGAKSNHWNTVIPLPIRIGINNKRQVII